MKPQIFKDKVAAFAGGIEYVEGWDAVYQVNGDPEDFRADVTVGLGRGGEVVVSLVVDWEAGETVGIEVGDGDQGPIEATAENFFAIALFAKAEQLAEIRTIVDDNALSYEEGAIKIEGIFYPDSAGAPAPGHEPEPEPSFLGAKPEEAIADALLTNGFGDKADRLVLTTKGGGDLGGLCRSSIIQTVREAVLAIATAGSPMVDKLEDGGRY